MYVILEKYLTERYGAIEQHNIQFEKSHVSEEGN